ncbi:hypothetical protein F5Y11DRAFT_316071 [Daldinia sp. FL1419]|nr:hypothetical protein F5Y11DRAFT_316071 [Daldinia sp. FL1419]
MEPMRFDQAPVYVSGYEGFDRYNVNDTSRDREFGITWTAADEANLQTRLKLTYLQKLWKMMIHIFEQSPSDLFTWGLRIGDDQDEIMRDLCEILPHQIFRGDVRILRYCLQKAIALRIKDHVQPFGFFQEQYLDKFKEVADEPAIPKEKKLNMAFLAWEETKSELETVIAPLVGELDSRAKRSEKEGTEQEKTFFVLEKIDIFNIRKALDSLFFKNIYPCRLDVCYFEFARTCGTVWPTFKPDSQRKLLQSEKVAVLNRRRARARGLPDIPQGRDGVYTLFPCWRSDKRHGEQVEKAMFQYGDWWTLDPAVPFYEEYF